MSSRGVFITGTDTNVGKTTFSALLVSALKRRQNLVRYFKPIQTGRDSDTATVARLARLTSNDVSEPIYEFPEPISPNRAALLNGQEIEIDRIKTTFLMNGCLSDAFRVIEGAGGLLVPINAKQTVRDLALALGFPLVIVASTRLGTINHTLLTVEAARTAGCRILGLVLNGEEDHGLAKLLAELTDLPVLANIEPLRTLNPDWIGELADGLFSYDAFNLIASSKGRD